MHEDIYWSNRFAEEEAEAERAAYRYKMERDKRIEARARMLADKRKPAPSRVFGGKEPRRSLLDEEYEMGLDSWPFEEV